MNQLSSFPYIYAQRGVWVDAEKKEHCIGDEFDFDDAYLKRAYIFMCKEEAAIKAYGDHEQKLFAEKKKELKNEIKDRGLPVPKLKKKK